VWLDLGVQKLVGLGWRGLSIDKDIYKEQESVGLAEYGVHKFVKPFFFATMLFFGLSFSMVGYFFLSRWRMEITIPGYQFFHFLALLRFYCRGSLDYSKVPCRPSQRL
jgi:hypothetical protein